CSAVSIGRLACRDRRPENAERIAAGQRDFPPDRRRNKRESFPDEHNVSSARQSCWGAISSAPPESANCERLPRDLRHRIYRSFQAGRPWTIATRLAQQGREQEIPPSSPENDRRLF